MATVEKLDLTINTAAIEVRNTSDRDIAAYAVSIDATYTDGQTTHSEKMVDYCPTVVSRNEALHPGATSDQMASWTPMRGVGQPSKRVLPTIPSVRAC